MSKKKNTLRDLDDFLKQQAATLVAPEPLTKVEHVKVLVSPLENVKEPEPEITSKKIIADIQALSLKQGESLRDTLYNLIIQSLENAAEYKKEDTMLINTALYLKSGEQWKEQIKAYWADKRVK